PLLAVLTSPPPDTVTLLVTLAGALLATVTVKVIVELLPAAREVDRVQVSVAGPVAGSVTQLQFVPLIAVAVRPAGSVSVTVIVPLVAVPPLLVTTMLYVAPVWPTLKLTLWLLVMVRSGGVLIVVGSVAVLFAVFVSPPPETVAVLVTLAGASLATFSVRVITGYLVPPARASDRVQVSGAKVQDQPDPVIAVAVKPVGSVSATVTRAVVLETVPLLLTVIV